MRYLKMLITPVLISCVMFIVCGFVYPVVTTGIAQLLFPYQANGSIMEANGMRVGSELVGQDFTDPGLMHCRPSAVNYNTYTDAEKIDGTYEGVASGSDNYAPSNPDLTERVSQDIEKFLTENPTIKKEDIPTDLLTASGSGLDPHISVASALVQVARIAEETGLPSETLTAIVKKNTEGKVMGVFGEERVNVLKVNLDILNAKKI